MVKVMETGGGTSTWLDEQLVADGRWADGVPADADPWVAAAFGGLATMSPEQLVEASAAADAAAAAEASSSAGVADSAEHAVAVDLWLTDRDDFVVADDGDAFAVDDHDLGTDDGADIEPADALAALAEAGAVPAETVPGLPDAFDSLDHDAPEPASEPTEHGADVTDVLADDIVKPAGPTASPTERRPEEITASETLESDQPSLPPLPDAATRDVFDASFDDAIDDIGQFTAELDEPGGETEGHAAADIDTDDDPIEGWDND